MPAKFRRDWDDEGCERRRKASAITATTQELHRTSSTVCPDGGTHQEQWSYWLHSFWLPQLLQGRGGHSPSLLHCWPSLQAGESRVGSNTGVV
jgi:hypothetical protein